MSKVRIEWSPEFAYAIGLLVTDGCLYSDGRHVDFTSKDVEQVDNFRKCLCVKTKIGFKGSGSSEKIYARVQFGDINFYNFLLKIGFMPRKSKIVGELDIPDRYFFDFLRGHLDGDGTFYSYWDPRWRSSYMFYTAFVSASEIHMQWIRGNIKRFLGIEGYIGKGKNCSVWQLKYAKTDSLKLLPKIYYNDQVICLSRKRIKIEKALRAVGLTMQCAGGEMAYTQP